MIGSGPAGIGRGECDENFAGAVAGDAAVAAEPERNAASEALELMRNERRVGADDNDDRATVQIAECSGGVGTLVGNLLADRDPRDAKIFARAIVALHQDTDCVGADFRFDFSRRRADAALEFVADHSRPAADVAFFDGAVVCGIDRVERVFGFDVKSIDVIEPAIPRFRDDGQRPPITGWIGLAVRDAPLDDGIANNAHAVRVGEHDWPFKKAGFFDPRGTGHFAIAVQRPPAGENGIVHRVFSTRKYGGHSRSNWSLAYLKFSFA